MNIIEKLRERKREFKEANTVESINFTKKEDELYVTFSDDDDYFVKSVFLNGLRVSYHWEGSIVEMFGSEALSMPLAFAFLMKEKK